MIDPNYRCDCGSLDCIGGQPLYTVDDSGKEVPCFFSDKDKANDFIAKSRIPGVNSEMIGAKYLSPIYLLHYLQVVIGRNSPHYFEGLIETVRTSNFDNDASIIEVVANYALSGKNATFFFKITDPTKIPNVGEQCWGDHDIFVIDGKTEQLYARQGEDVKEVNL